jgi:hypothetical protein
MKELAEDYKKLLAENKALKQELTIKESIIQKLKEDLEQYKAYVISLKEKLEEITRKAGARLMRIFGINVPDETPEYPSKDVNEEIKRMQKGLDEKDSRLYRVIPDNEDGKYRVVYRNAAGLYETVAGGFSSRDLADKYRKNMSEAARELGNGIKNGLKDGIS